MKYQLSIIQYPSGRFGFVGSVPLALAYQAKDGSPVSPEMVERQMLLPASYRSIVGRSWASADAALDEAMELGFSAVLAK